MIAQACGLSEGRAGDCKFRESVHMLGGIATSQLILMGVHWWTTLVVGLQYAAGVRIIVGALLHGHDFTKRRGS